MRKRRPLQKSNLSGVALYHLPRNMNFRITSLVLFFLLINSGVSAQQDFFPFLGKIKEKSVHIRAGQSKSFESLGRLNLDQNVVVEDKSYSWYKIRLPQHANSFISNEFVTMINHEVGEITSNRVNIRAGAGINFTVLGQVNKGDRILILNQLDSWYKIQPVKGSYGWISEDLIDFVSSDVSKYIPGEVEQDLFEAALEETAETTPEPEELIPEVSPTSFQGILTANKNTKDSGFQYLLNNDSEKIYYLDGFSQLLNPFINYKVKIEGYIKDVPKDAYMYPVVVVTRIQLIL
ncbi:MAG: SH3 domain-containing protein [Candidatus Omnitrophota bacterium]